MNYKNGLVMAKAFECFQRDFTKDKANIEIDTDYIIYPNMMVNRKTTKLNEIIFEEVKRLTPP